MKMYGIERNAVQPDWKMRLHPWLDMKTMKPQFSVTVRHPEKRKWAHVYEEGAEFFRMFKSEASATRYMAKLKKAKP
jgi:hypothetical protein